MPWYVSDWFLFLVFFAPHRNKTKVKEKMGAEGTFFMKEACLSIIWVYIP